MNEATNQQLSVSNLVENPDLGVVTILVSNGPLVQGSFYRISMKFTSYLNDELRGFYRSSYVDEGVTK